MPALGNVQLRSRDNRGVLRAAAVVIFCAQWFGTGGVHRQLQCKLLLLSSYRGPDVQPLSSLLATAVSLGLRQVCIHSLCGGQAAWRRRQPNLHPCNVRPTSILTTTFQSTISLLLNWGPIIFVPVVFGTTLLIEKQDGVRKATLWVACLCFSCSLIRAAPCLLLPGDGARAGSRGQFLALACAHVAQILNAAAGPFVMSAPSKLSETWCVALHACAGKLSRCFCRTVFVPSISQTRPPPACARVLRTCACVCCSVNCPIACRTAPPRCAENLQLGKRLAV